MAGGLFSFFKKNKKKSEREEQKEKTELKNGVARPESSGQTSETVLKEDSGTDSAAAAQSAAAALSRTEIPAGGIEKPESGGAAEVSKAAAATTAAAATNAGTAGTAAETAAVTETVKTAEVTAVKEAAAIPETAKAAEAGVVKPAAAAPAAGKATKAAAVKKVAAAPETFKAAKAAAASETAKAAKAAAVKKAAAASGAAKPAKPAKFVAGKQATVAPESVKTAKATPVKPAAVPEAAKTSTAMTVKQADAISEAAAAKTGPAADTGAGQAPSPASGISEPAAAPAGDEAAGSAALGPAAATRQQAETAPAAASGKEEESGGGFFSFFRKKKPARGKPRPESAMAAPDAAPAGAPAEKIAEAGKEIAAAETAGTAETRAAKESKESEAAGQATADTASAATLSAQEVPAAEKTAGEPAAQRTLDKAEAKAADPGVQAEGPQVKIVMTEAETAAGAQTAAPAAAAADQTPPAAESASPAPEVTEKPAAAGSDSKKVKLSFFERLKKTRQNLSYGLEALISGKKISEELYEDLETALLTADLGVYTTTRIIEKLRTESKVRDLHDAAALRQNLKKILKDILRPCEVPLQAEKTSDLPYVILMVGVNGAGKTTTIGKLALKFRAKGQKVMLAAGDTFRAAAVEQLKEWGRRTSVPVISQAAGSDSASVIYDALVSAKSKNVDVLICDTAGRLQNKEYLMKELKKIVRVMKKIDERVPHEVLLVLDATTGQNAVSQLKLFNDAVKVTGICISKLDGTAKGGVIFALADQFGIPFRFVGIGEKTEDLREFNTDYFVDALIED